MKPAPPLASTAPVPFTTKDRFVRYVVLPLVMAVGLYGLVRYAVTGENGTTDQFAPPSSEATAMR
jgi:hypothetical protein